jgi:hypothetical protein
MYAVRLMVAASLVMASLVMASAVVAFAAVPTPPPIPRYLVAGRLNVTAVPLPGGNPYDPRHPIGGTAPAVGTGNSFGGSGGAMPGGSDDANGGWRPGFHSSDGQ